MRSSLGFFVEVSGLRWLSLSVLADIPWAGRVWALPFLTVLCPSARFYARLGRAPTKLTDRARQAVLQVARWLPESRVVVVADSGFAAVDLLAAVGRHVAVVTRLRLDAARYDPAGLRRPGQRGRTPTKGARQPSLAARIADPATVWTQTTVSRWYGESDRTVGVATGTAVWYRAGKAVVPLRWVLVRDPEGEVDPKGLLCTDLNAAPLDIVGWYVRRWSVEVTFAEVRRHLGVETQRQGAAPAIARTTPCLLGLFSLVALVADQLAADGTAGRSAERVVLEGTSELQRRAGGVRLALWREAVCPRSGSGPRSAKNVEAVFERMGATLAYAA